MSTFTSTYIADVCRLHSQIDKIRNMCVIAHVDHGKTTLVDFLLAKAGVISYENAGNSHVVALSKEEAERQITMKASGVSLPIEKDGENYLINLVDSPGHVDFSSEVTAALRITDGALVVVDCIEGARVQTETVIRQALGERIKPVLHVNKIDRAILELKLNGEELYLKLNKVIESVNALFGTYEDTILGDVSVDPIKGNVSFGSGKQGWAFTLPGFAKLFSSQVDDTSKLVKRLWGENYYDPETKKFYNTPVSPAGTALPRYAVSVMLDPILKVFNAVGNEDIAALDAMLPKMNVKLHEAERSLQKNDLLKLVLRRWLPIGDTITRMVIEHLPSPKIAQQYRVANLYTGPGDDETARAIRECDPNGPVTVFISKMIDPEGDGKRFYAFGRVFSGTIKPQQEVRIMGPNYVFGEQSNLKVKKVPGLVLFFGPKIEGVSEIPCGNTIGISGIDKILTKSGTIASLASAHPIAPMKFSVAPVVRRSVYPENTAQLQKFTDALKRLEKVDPCLQVITNSNEFIVAGAGEFHVDVALGELQKILSKEVPFRTSPPIVPFAESVSAKSSVICLGKSTNKHNRLFVTAEPISEKLCRALEENTIPQKDSKERAKILCDEYGWSKTDANKVWCFKGTNVLVDMTFAISYLDEAKEHLISALGEISERGILCGEPLRGVRFNVHDAKLHPENVHRNAGQLIPCARQVFYAAMLAAKPIIIEPYFLAEIETDHNHVGKVYALVSHRRGTVIEEIPKAGTPLTVIKAHLPVEKSFKFDAALRETTGGHGFLQLMFSHWATMSGDPMKSGTLPNTTVMEVRKRKEMKDVLPTLEEYNDKL